MGLWKRLFGRDSNSSTVLRITPSSLAPLRPKTSGDPPPSVLQVEAKPLSAADSKGGDLEERLQLLPLSKRNRQFWPEDELDPVWETDLPSFSYQLLWQKLSELIDRDPRPRRVDGYDGSSICLSGRRDKLEKGYPLSYNIYRIGEDEYGVVVHSGGRDSGGSLPLRP